MNTKFLSATLLILLFLVHQESFAQTSTTPRPDKESMDIKFQYLANVKHLLIGFKIDEGDIGSTYIINKSGEVVHRQENFEMSIYPAYNAIDISKYKAGTYVVRIVTAKNNEYETTVIIE
jgi:hypothetical protein